MFFGPYTKVFRLGSALCLPIYLVLLLHIFHVEIPGPVLWLSVASLFAGFLMMNSKWFGFFFSRPTKPREQHDKQAETDGPVHDG